MPTRALAINIRSIDYRFSVSIHRNHNLVHACACLQREPVFFSSFVSVLPIDQPYLGVSPAESIKLLVILSPVGPYYKVRARDPRELSGWSQQCTFSRQAGLMYLVPVSLRFDSCREPQVTAARRVFMKLCPACVCVCVCV